MARVLRPRGRRGEVVAELHSDFPERLAERRRLLVVAPGGSRRELELEEHWLHQGRLILKFRGVDSINEAGTLSGSEIQIRREERVPLPAGSAYVSDLIGCKVLDAASQPPREIGAITDVLFGFGDAPLLEVREGDHEYLVPFAEAYLKRLDLDARLVEMVLPQGLLNLEAKEESNQGGETGEPGTQ
ncbi:MAG: ribosome maturation factor RimM [Terriglobales bacterium]